MTFTFDSQYAMFDITPVDNLFLTEYLPQAKGDYVRVYLYGLMRCYHPDPDFDLARMGQDLNLSEEEVSAALRYWERKGLVRRASDHPPVWQFLNARQRSMTLEDHPDPAYEAFCEAIYDVFDNGRRLHGSELQTCFEWVEELKLPTEVVIMLLRHLAARNKNFSIRSADKLAAKMADEGVATLEDAEAFLSRDRQAHDGIRTVLRKLGKRGLPSEEQLNWYLRWRDDWHFTPEAIEEACALTADSPTLSYLNGVLESIRAAYPDAVRITPDMVRADHAQGERLRAVNRDMNRSAPLTREEKRLLADLEKDFPPQVVSIAARECAQSGQNLTNLRKLLTSWQEKGLTTADQVEQYVQSFHAETDLLRSLQRLWQHGEPKIGETNRRKLRAWTGTLGFREDAILQAAEYAVEADKPMAYLDKLLKSFADQGVKTPEAIAAAHAQQAVDYTKSAPRSGEKTVIAQQYTQRDYTGVQEELTARFIRESSGEYVREDSRHAG